MAREVRSEATRRKILAAAIEVFGEVGYAAAGWSAIIERTGMTKGALYHHFDSKEALASAIIEEGSAKLLSAFRDVCGSSSPGLENLLHGTFTIVKVLSTDEIASAAEDLIRTLGGFNTAAGSFCTDMIELMATEARRAIAEGDLRKDADATVIGESIIGAVLGMRLLSNAVFGHDSEKSAGDGVERLAKIWELLLPGIVSEPSQPYFRQFLAREKMRHARAETTAVQDETS
ncbi:MAG: TetR/AcrR family transcriptional regulator [Actinomycetota bacterium]|uniref:TetR/AcrR family transcriptional regulator n=1 Tax=Mycobacterium lentiflavum TaxID=141349 RepID=A0ABY3USA7_MYCLN|nr:TetR/AcrR family transcriptional regulator [Mycobacterium lentiflavum]MEE3065418.1 TetR/AcrR family transcriptional regulator [Actinomycetota bacterium]ULP41484.1 TetR/AcrR family transcriptional regulator [Mycobacterium lentiflavum]